MKIPEIPKEHLLCPANLVRVGMRQKFAQRSSLVVASDSRCQTTTARYKCNRVANTITLNPLALAKEDRADNSDVPKVQRESIRTRRERLHGMRLNIERTLAVGLSQELPNGFDIFSIRLQQGDEGVTGCMPADLLVNAICLRNRLDFTLHEIVRPKGLLSPHGLAGEDVIVIRCVDI
jgi:hypothetical protein